MRLGPHNLPYRKWKKATQDSHLEAEMKESLTDPMQHNNVFTTAAGCTGLLKLKIFFEDMPIEQRPYSCSPRKQKVLQALLVEMFEK